VCEADRTWLGTQDGVSVTCPNSVAEDKWEGEQQSSHQHEEKMTTRGHKYAPSTQWHVMTPEDLIPHNPTHHTIVQELK